MPNLKAYQKHVDRFGHEDVMIVAASDPHMSERDVVALGRYISTTAKKLIKPSKKGK